MAPPAHWIGRYPVAVGSTRSWRLGPLEVLAHRLESEWQLGARWSEDPLDERLGLGEAAGEEALDACAWAVRIPGLGESDALELRARTADRPVIARPDTKILIPPRAAIDVFLGSAAWVELWLGSANLGELPVWRPSDTWFGPNPREGTLCYASRTQARTEFEKLPPAPGRITTQATIVNEGERTTDVESIGLPLPAMSVFRDAGGRLWTEAVEVRIDSSGSAPARLGASPPDRAGACDRVADPRTPPDAGGLVDAFSALIGGKTPWAG